MRMKGLIASYRAKSVMRQTCSMFKTSGMSTGTAKEYNMFGNRKKKKKSRNPFPRTSFIRCRTCKSSMNEIVYSREFHREMYWCPRCGSVLIEIDANDTWLVPEFMNKQGMTQAESLAVLDKALEELENADTPEKIKELEERLK